MKVLGTRNSKLREFVFDGRRTGFKFGGWNAPRQGQDRIGPCGRGDFSGVCSEGACGVTSEDGRRGGPTGGEDLAHGLCALLDE